MTGRDLPKSLGVLDATAIVLGIVIGSGIFIVPGAIARSVPATGTILAVWLAAGLLSLFGALAFAELGAMMPATGGQYIYLRETYGPFWAFLFGWGLLLVQRSGSTATLAAGFSIYLDFFIPLTPVGAKLASAGIILLLTTLNYRGVRGSAWVQKVFTTAKVAALALLIVGLFAAPVPSAIEWNLLPRRFRWEHLGVAMLASLWAYNGWFAVSFVAGELRQPARDLAWSLAAGMGIAILLFTLANVAYCHVLSIAEIAGTDRVAAVALERAFGPTGAAFLSLTVLVSIIGAINGGILSAPRVYFAMARDGLFFQKLAEVHPRFQTPAAAVLAQGLWAALLALTGTFHRLLEFSLFISWIFYGMAVFGVLLLRRRDPHRPRPYGMWGYPVTPLLFVLSAIGLVLNTLITRPGPALAGLAIMTTGLPAYLFWRRRANAPAPPAS